MKDPLLFILLFLAGCAVIDPAAIEAKRIYQDAGCCAEIINEDAICYHCQNAVDRNIFLRWDNSWED